MEEEIITLKVAKLAKAKGFNEACNDMYFREMDTISSTKMDMGGYPNRYSNAIAAPTQSLLQKWLREKHNVIVEIGGINCHIDVSFIKYYSYNIMGNLYNQNDDEHNTWEEALEAGLQEALEGIDGS